ncbi:MAG: hypothetical protein KKC96_00105 [Nanoarchaeota archaeon]|nr:hypothetical protein [Nanoarchaeota archaeon]
MPGKTRLGKIPQMEILNQGEIDQLPEYIKDGKEGDETPKIEDEDLTERKKSSQDAGSQFAKELEARFGDGATGDTTPQEESSGGDNELEKRLSDVMTQANTDAEDYSKSLNGMLGEEFKDDNYTTGESDEPTLSEEEFEEDMARLTPEEESRYMYLLGRKEHTKEEERDFLRLYAKKNDKREF